MSSLNKFTIPLFQTVHEPRSLELLSKDVDLSIRLELAALGYCLPDNYDLSTGYLNIREDVISTLNNITGAYLPHQTLFAKFPYKTVDEMDYFIKRWISHIKQIFDDPSERGIHLSCGCSIDPEVFDLSDFGACPICQFQVDELRDSSQKRYDLIKLLPLKELKMQSQPHCVDLHIEKLVMKQSSLSSLEKEFVEYIIDNSRETWWDIKSPIFKETLPIIYNWLHDPFSQISGATDVLRIACYWSDKEADLSLKDVAKFKLSSVQKRRLFKLLENQKNISEDLLRHRNRWIAFARHTHLLTKGNSKRYPKMHKAFETLMFDSKSITTYNRTIERGLLNHNVDYETAASRPTDFIRRLDHMIRQGNNHAVILKWLAVVVKKAKTKVLFDVKKYYHNRNNGTERIFFPKGGSNKVHIIPDTRPDLDQQLIGTIIEIFEMEIKSRMPIGPVMIHISAGADLSKQLMPFNERGDSTKSEQVAKGSYMPLPEMDVLRLFVYWKGDVDLDLSANLLDENMNYLSNISYTSLGSVGGKACHSGDIQNAPKGASEFVDIDIEKCKAAGIRYVASSLISYRGDGFEEYQTICGYMGRDGLKSGEVFEPTTVLNTMQITSKSNSHMTYMFDLEQMEVVLLDVNVGGRAFQNTSDNKFLTTIKHIMNLCNTKTTQGDIVDMYNKVNISNKMGKHVDVDFLTELYNYPIKDGDA